jgi:hypothetical protein
MAVRTVPPFSKDRRLGDALGALAVAGEARLFAGSEESDGGAAFRFAAGAGVAWLPPPAATTRRRAVLPWGDLDAPLPPL